MGPGSKGVVIPGNTSATPIIPPWGWHFIYIFNNSLKQIKYQLYNIK
jgi:hypothetical protein